MSMLSVAAAYKQPVFQVFIRLKDAYLAAFNNKRLSRGHSYDVSSCNVDNLRCLA